MLYSIQEKYSGEVCGIFQTPYINPPLTPEEFATRLADEMADKTAYPTKVRVEAAALAHQDSEGRVSTDRVVVSLEDHTIVEMKALEDIHTAVGLVILMNEIDA